MPRNPVVVLGPADGPALVGALLALALEVKAVQLVLRRGGFDTGGHGAHLLLVQLLTWVPFLGALEIVEHRALTRRGGSPGSRCSSSLRRCR